MYKTRLRLSALIAAAFMVGCSSSDFNLTEQDKNDTIVDITCAEQPDTVLISIEMASDAALWSGVCGPEVISLTYDDELYSWIGEPAAMLCPEGSEDAVMELRQSQVYFSTSVSHWCTQQTVQVNGGFQVLRTEYGELVESLLDCSFDITANVEVWEGDTTNETTADDESEIIIGDDLQNGATAFKTAGLSCSDADGNQITAQIGIQMEQVSN